VIVIDASAALGVLLRTPSAASLEARLFQPGESLHAPHLIDLEIAQVLRRYALSKQARARRCHQALEDWQVFSVHGYPHEPLLARVWRLRGNLTAYDAAYIALAEALDAPLLTRDARIANAPGHGARIELAP
jgi:predicted nucleic acid-binding protein